MSFRADLGLDLMARATLRAQAYYCGLDDAIDGKQAMPYCAWDHADSYRRGYRDGLAQLAAFPFRPVTTNPSRDNG